MLILLLIAIVVAAGLIYRSIASAIRGIPHSNEDFNAFCADVAARSPSANPE